MAESSWLDSNPRNFVSYTSKEALLVSSIVQCALTEGSKELPIYPIFFRGNTPP